MLYSLALILLCGFAAGGLMKQLRLPAMLGMMMTGAVLGPFCLNLIDKSILSLSQDLRTVALIVILLRAGLALDIGELKKAGRPALLLCFFPATFELAAVTVFAPTLLGITRLEAAILGAVLAAVSPAVLVPRMLRLMEQGYGNSKGIPQMLMAGASVDDVYVIVVFTALTGMHQGRGFDALSLLQVPVSIVSGLGLGIAAGAVMAALLQKWYMRDTVKALLLLGIAFLFLTAQDALTGILPLSGLLAVMAMGGAIFSRNAPLAERLSQKYAKIWVAAELVLFVLVGAAVDFRYIGKAGPMAVLLIFTALFFRCMGVLVCIAKSGLTKKEKLFALIAYLPKATVQAAIAGIPLAIGIPAGEMILAVAVLAITITAPLGAIGIDRTYKKLLTAQEPPS